MLNIFLCLWCETHGIKIVLEMKTWCFVANIIIALAYPLLGRDGLAEPSGIILRAQ